MLRSCVSSAEAVDFPCVEQVALLRRHLRHHAPETVALVTNLPPAQLDAAQWLAANRAAWGIENGLHQRLDVSHLDDLCRVRLPQSMRIMEFGRVNSAHLTERLVPGFIRNRRATKTVRSPKS